MDFAPLVPSRSLKIRTTHIEDDYSIGHPLGHGAAGIIMSCSSLHHGKSFAVKVLPCDTEARKQRAEKEVTIWNDCLPHPNIVDLVAVYDNYLDNSSALLAAINAQLAQLGGRSFGAGKYLCAVMPNLKGGELYEYASTETTDEETVLTIADQLVSALAHIHARGYVHGDLKLENVLLLRPVSESLAVQICDFGFARSQDEWPKREFTVGYISPEALRSYERGCMLYVGKASDMWALGVLLFTLYAKHYPFEGLPSEPGYRDNRTITPHNRQAVLQGRLSLRGPEWASASSLFKDALRRLLAPSIAARLTADQLRKHAWLGEGKSVAHPAYAAPLTAYELTA